ncbi:hypothetical protein ALC57_08094 [Trachymyrmex cornetzi]|uniref:Uncharacterized protein n=1 Tax=Trachymyrmex cornetzi TaxID=471704 RepID=A0A195E394_9HYME|nr:hypothetical protein ALC57_08094 [Trachymyrmex cornetzi]
MEDEVLSNFIPEESRAIGISIVHLHNSRSTTDRKNAHVAASNHDRRGTGGTRTRFANSRLIEKLVRHKNREIIAAGKMREKSPDYLRGAEATVPYVATDTLFAHLFLMDAQHGNCTSGWTSLQNGFSKFKESNDGMYSEA